MVIERGRRDNECVWCRCSQCERSTKHTILASASDSGFIEGPDIHFHDDYAIVQCNGCENVCFLKASSNSDDIDWERNEPIEVVKTYPEPNPNPHDGAAYIRDDVYSMPGIVQSIYSETLGAIRNDLPVLAGIGVRAIVEAICHDLNSKGRTLENKIDGLVDKALLGPKGAEILHGLRLLGNNAAHQIKAPEKEQVAAAIKVIDYLLIGAYVIPDEAKVLPTPSKSNLQSTKGPIKKKPIKARGASK